ncbi:hypothetical protein AC1659_29555, partial [Rhodococcus erythropolis]|nr:hypothetical protein [Rhodococcus erythropolis]
SEMPNRSTALIQSLNTLLTPERLAPYKAAAGDDIEGALDLYEWNSRISAAVFEDLGYLEVALRNACHNQLIIWNQRENNDVPWYFRTIFGQESQKDIEKARRALYSNCRCCGCIGTTLPATGSRTRSRNASANSRK